MQENVLLKSHETYSIEPLGEGYATAVPRRPARHRFWEIDSHFKCPVVGMCLSPHEQRQLLKKTGISFKRKSAIELHEILVGSSDKENPLSRKVDTLLNGKFNREIKELQELEDGDFIEHWRSCFKSGNIKATFWVAVTRPDLSIDTKRQIFGDVHMEMHNTGDHIARLKQSLAAEQIMRQKADEKHKSELASRRALQKEKAELENTVRELTGKLAFVEKEKAVLSHELVKFKSGAYETLEMENNRLGIALADLSRKVAEYATRLAAEEKKNQRLLEKSARQCDLNAHIKDEMEVVLQQCRDMNACEESCPSFDLCQKRVLIVGGITRMESLYRDLVEGSGGIFEYHDGNMRNGSRKLESSLKRADIILCPVNCNSHAACLLVKKLGKKYNKPIHMLTSSSLNGVSQILGGEWIIESRGLIPGDDSESSIQ